MERLVALPTEGASCAERCHFVSDFGIAMFGGYWLGNISREGASAGGVKARV